MDHMKHRPFDESCPIYRASQALGDACTLMILRDLFLQGPRKFQDFHAQSRGFSPNTVSLRLKKLLDQGLIQTRLYQDHPPRYVYSLTISGRKLEPILAAMFTWATDGKPPPRVFDES